jgi:hypothetical protein
VLDSLELRKLWMPLGDAVAFRMQRGEVSTHLHGDFPFEAGSCFKAFVAAECCRQVEQEIVAWEDQLVVVAGDRVPASRRLDAMSNGATLSLRDAVDAMLAVSDNTATDLVMRHIGVDTIRVLLEAMGLHATSIPDSVADVYRQANVQHARACTTTMDDLTRFYRKALDEEGGILPPAARKMFAEVMRAEDVEQMPNWPHGVECLRKSGSLEPPPIYARALAGVICQGDVMTCFAFALNLDVGSEDIPVEEATRFDQGLTLGMRAIVGG